uniref:Uncharacterized protein n=1 Tax=Cyprinus carpio TaxID=7962 RepID=A0A8C1G0A3_CYPCA
MIAKREWQSFQFYIKDVHLCIIFTVPFYEIHLFFTEHGFLFHYQDFLKTVDILVLEKAAASWQSLTKENTSISLLSAVENISSHLSDILIPQVLKTTTLTILVFKNLHKILPSHNSGNLVSHINGDVVIVKVNETLNNISFTFDITDQSLGNPQCVFWNFNLVVWDSTGCEVKRKNTGKITCECNHTTTFLILINDTSYMRHVSIVNIDVSLLIANICFIIEAVITEQQQPTSVSRCSPVVFFMHFFYLALFFWMLMSALLLFYRTVMVLSQMSRAKMMVIVFVISYGAPLLIAVITVASSAGQENYIFRRNACWLNWYESKALLGFVIPALTIVVINLMVLIKHALVVIARCVAILTPIFGLTMVSQDLGIHVVFALLNSLQVLLSVFQF